MYRRSGKRVHFSVRRKRILAIALSQQPGSPCGRLRTQPGGQVRVAFYSVLKTPLLEEIVPSAPITMVVSAFFKASKMIPVCVIGD